MRASHPECIREMRDLSPCNSSITIQQQQSNKISLKYKGGGYTLNGMRVRKETTVGGGDKADLTKHTSTNLPWATAGETTIKFGGSQCAYARIRVLHILTAASEWIILLLQLMLALPPNRADNKPPSCSSHIERPGEANKVGSR